MHTHIYVFFQKFESLLATHATVWYGSYMYGSGVAYYRLILIECDNVATVTRTFDDIISYHSVHTVFSIEVHSTASRLRTRQG